MAISTRKRNILISDWKTGQFKSINAIAKKHKVDPKTAGRILEGVTHENKDIVDSLEIVKSVEKTLKNSVKNPNDFMAVERAVQARLKVHSVSGKILDGVEELLDHGKASKVVTVGQGGGLSSSEVVELPLQADDFKKLSDTVDRVSVTQEVNPRFSNAPVVENNINNQNSQQNNISIQWD